MLSSVVVVSGRFCALRFLRAPSRSLASVPSPARGIRRRRDGAPPRPSSGVPPLLRGRDDARAASDGVRFESLVPSTARGALAALRGVGFTHATAIQALALPVALSGRDVIVAAETASGKTLCFALPCAVAVERAVRGARERGAGGGRGATALVLVPSAELALQTATVLSLVGARPVLVRPGARSASEALGAGLDVEPCTLVGTPASVAGALAEAEARAGGRGTGDSGAGGSACAVLSGVRLVALDEADSLMGGSHRRDLEFVLAALHRKLALHAPGAVGGGGAPAAVVTAPPRAIPAPFRLARGVQYVCTAATLLSTAPRVPGASGADGNTAGFAHWAHRHLRHAEVVRSPRLHALPARAALAEVRVSSDALRARASALARGVQPRSTVAGVGVGGVMGGGANSAAPVTAADAAEALYPELLEEARTLAVLRALGELFPQPPGVAGAGRGADSASAGVAGGSGADAEGLTTVRFREDDGRAMPSGRPGGVARRRASNPSSDVDEDAGGDASDEDELPQAIVFCNSALAAARTAGALSERAPHLRVVAMHSGLTHAGREGAFCAFQDGAADVLVATDVAARGLDTLRVALVVSAALPESLTVFLHRAGRTSRSGAPGRVTTVLVSPEEDARYAAFCAPPASAALVGRGDAVAVRRNAAHRVRRLRGERGGK